MNPRNPYLTSSLLHACVLTAAMALSFLHRPPPLVPNVRIVSMGGGKSQSVRTGGRNPAPTAPQEPVVQQPPKPVPKPVEKPVEVKKKTDSPPPRPANKPQEKAGTEPPRKTEIVSKGPPKAVTPTATTATAATGGAESNAQAAAGKGEVGFEADGDPGPLSGYLGLLRDRVAQAWAAPLTVGHKGEVRCVVFFVIERTGGAPQQLVIQESSGDAGFDRAAMRAVLNVAPLAPLPASWGTDSVGIRFTFFQNY